MPDAVGISIGGLVSQLGGTYGNWGGKDWSGGKFTAEDEEPDWTVEALDPLDAGFKSHDHSVWDARALPASEYRNAIIAADKQLLNDMWVISENDISAFGEAYRETASIVFLTKLAAESVLDIAIDVVSATVGGLYDFFSDLFGDSNQVQDVSVSGDGSINVDFVDGSASVDVFDIEGRTVVIDHSFAEDGSSLGVQYEYFDETVDSGAPVDYIFCLLSGKVGVYKKDKEGKKVLIASLGKGFIFGEMSFLDGGPASATVKAGLPFQVLTINQGALHRLLENQPKLGHKILKAMAHQTSLRLRQADDMLAGFPGTSREFTVA